MVRIDTKIIPITYKNVQEDKENILEANGCQETKDPTKRDVFHLHILQQLRHQLMPCWCPSLGRAMPSCVGHWWKKDWAEALSNLGIGQWKKIELSTRTTLLCWRMWHRGEQSKNEQWGNLGARARRKFKAKVKGHYRPQLWCKKLYWHHGCVHGAAWSARL